MCKTAEALTDVIRRYLVQRQRSYRLRQRRAAMTKLVRVLSWSLLVGASCMLLELGPSSRTNVFAAPQNLQCDDSINAAFHPDRNTSVTLVKAFRQGDQLLLSGAATNSTPIAESDICLVKLLVGPGNPGPAD